MFIIDLILYYFVGCLMVKTFRHVKNVFSVLGRITLPKPKSTKEVKVQTTVTKQPVPVVTKRTWQREWQEVDLSDSPLKKQVVAMQQKQNFRDN